MDENERFVREYWKALGNLWWDREYDENWISASDEKGQPIRLFRGRSTDAEAWAGAADFTRKRIEEIRQLNNDLATIRVDLGFAKTDHTQRVYAHVISILEPILAGKTAGMKQLPS